MTQACFAKLLLIDDEKGFHDLLRYLVEPLGVKVSSAFNGKEGISLGLHEDFSVIFLELHLPKMSGIEVLEQIRAAKPGQSIVVMTSHSDATRVLEKQVRSMGADAFLEKPFDIEQVAEVLEKTLGIKVKT